ncbi:uncharacterized protein LOC116658785 isoform X1 [Camelus ferus]|uniref:Uncharacterized protein LOC116658785 isoform X1 n=1 Tax=Camelus ferus TaxID=419612 RepID=A0A8B8RR62_CAMFR|nr:uncharacterized protein LOC116658785 isoform X1 [Camelus ferus]
MIKRQRHRNGQRAGGRQASISSRQGKAGEAVGVAAQWRSLSTPTPNTRQRQRLGLRLRSREWVTKREEQDRRQGVRGAARPASSCVLRASPSATLRAEVMAPAASSLPTQTGRAPPPAPPRPCLLTRAGRPPPPSYSHWEGEAWQVLQSLGRDPVAALPSRRGKASGQWQNLHYFPFRFFFFLPERQAASLTPRRWRCQRQWGTTQTDLRSQPRGLRGEVLAKGASPAHEARAARPGEGHVAQAGTRSAPLPWVPGRWQDWPAQGSSVLRAAGAPGRRPLWWEGLASSTHPNLEQDVSLAAGTSRARAAGHPRRRPLPRESAKETAFGANPPDRNLPWVQSHQ